MKRENRTRDVIIQLIATVFLATSGIFVRHISIAPLNVGFWRILFSMFLLYPMVHKNLKKLSKKDWLLLILSGAALGGDIAFCNLAFDYTSIANVSVLTNMTAFIVVPVSYFIFKEKIPKLFFPGAILSVIGVIVLIKGKAISAPSGYFGDFLLILGLAVCMQLIGHNLVSYCQGKLSANLSCIIGLTQPVSAALLSWIIFNEVLTLQEWIGIVIVIAGVYLVKAQYKSKK